MNDALLRSSRPSTGCFSVTETFPDPALDVLCFTPIYKTLHSLLRQPEHTILTKCLVMKMVSRTLLSSHACIDFASALYVVFLEDNHTEELVLSAAEIHIKGMFKSIRSSVCRLIHYRLVERLRRSLALRDSARLKRSVDKRLRELVCECSCRMKHVSYFMTSIPEGYPWVPRDRSGRTDVSPEGRGKGKVC